MELNPATDSADLDRLEARAARAIAAGAIYSNWSILWPWPARSPSDAVQRRWNAWALAENC
jgi:hypothetical protein